MHRSALKNKSWLLFSVAILGSFVVGSFLIFWHPLSLARQLEVRERGSEKIFLTIPITVGEKFVLSYTHSLDGTEVREEYRVESSGLTFLSYTGSRAAIEYRGYTGPNQRVEFEQSVAEIPLNPEPTGKQTLHIRDKSYALWQLNNQASIRIRLRSGSLR